MSGGDVLDLASRIALGLLVLLAIASIVVAGARRVLRRPSDVDEDAPAIRNFREKQPSEGNRRVW